MSALTLFADTVGNGPRINATFHAAFTYDVDTRLAALKGRAIILATQSSLLEPSRRAARLIQEAELLEVPEIQGSVLNQNAKRTAKAVLAAMA